MSPVAPGSKRSSPLHLLSDPAINVFIFVDTSNDVGDADHLEVFRADDAADTWLEPTSARLHQRS
jgi:hypothetical protein